MADPIWTQQDIDTLKEAIASGVLSVTYSGPPQRTMTYQNLDAMRSLLASMIADVGNADGTRPTYKKMGTRKGFNPRDCE